MQHIDDTITTVPDWFVKCYESGLIWIILAVMGILAIALTIVACKLYFELKELHKFLNKSKEE